MRSHIDDVVLVVLTFRGGDANEQAMKQLAEMRDELFLDVVAFEEVQSRKCMASSIACCSGEILLVVAVM